MTIASSLQEAQPRIRTGFSKRCNLAMSTSAAKKVDHTTFAVATPTAYLHEEGNNRHRGTFFGQLNSSRENIMKRLLTGTAIAIMLGAAPVLAADPSVQTAPMAPDAAPGAIKMPTTPSPAPSGGGTSAPMNRQSSDDRMNAEPSVPAHSGVNLPKGQAIVAPANGISISEVYKQDVYDKSDNKVGSVNDVVLGDNGEPTTVILGVGGVLGLGEKDVALPFDAIHIAQKDGKRYLTIDTTKEALESAPGLTFDRNGGRWIPAQKQPS